MALWGALLAIAAGPRAARAWTTRSAFSFYVLAAVLMYVFSFGPEPVLFGVPFWYRPPYAWLMQLPGFSNVRAPARFALLAVLCLSVAAAIAFERLRAVWPGRGAIAIAAVALATATTDGWFRGLPLAGLPPRRASVQTHGDGAVAELPIGNLYDDLAAMYRSIYDRRPVVNGYSGFEPVHYTILKGALAAHEPDVLGGLATDGPLTVVEATGVVTIPRSDRALTAPSGRPLRLHAVAVDGSAIDLVAITDGDRHSRWHSGAVQRGTEVMTIDLGDIRTVEGVVLNLGDAVHDYPRSLVVETSEDGRVWTMNWSGRGAALAVAGAIRDPAMVPLTLGFAATPARWVRLRQVGVDPGFLWSIAELTVYGR